VQAIQNSPFFFPGHYHILASASNVVLQIPVQQAGPCPGYKHLSHFF